jgi:hypothetical protein
VKNFIAAVIASVPGVLLGVALWTALACCLLAIYWIGYEMAYLGLVCGRGKLGLGWLAPPSPPMQEAIRGWAFFLTAFAFKVGELFAAFIGALFGGAAGVGGMRFVGFLRRRRNPEKHRRA